MMDKLKLLKRIERELTGGGRVDQKTIENLFPVDGELLPELIAAADRVRVHFHGKSVQTCAILNTKCGSCSEDCIYCAQSAHYNTGIKNHPLLSEEQMINAAREAAEGGAQRFSFVTSGKGLNSKDVDQLADVLRRLTAELPAMEFCLSLGILGREELIKLREAGASQYHHNLETSRAFYPKICTTHSWQDRVDTVNAARSAGFDVCSGGLFGLGEGWQERIDLAFQIRALQIDSIPLNFLSPIPDTPAEKLDRLSSSDALQIIVLFRLIHPHVHLRLCGGRAATLGDRQSTMFAAGADGMMIGNYLVTTGSPYQQDIGLIKALGMEPAQPEAVHK